jgi:hypothetical protein
MSGRDTDIILDLFFKLELETGLPRHRLLYLASQLVNYADANRDGKVTCKEWEDWIKAKGHQPFQKSKAVGGLMQVLAYSPTYSCCPPAIFIASITFLQILFYILW